LVEIRAFPDPLYDGLGQGAEAIRQKLTKYLPRGVKRVLGSSFFPDGFGNGLSHEPDLLLTLDVG
jgi:hypothetical protein